MKTQNKPPRVYRKLGHSGVLIFSQLPLSQLKVLYWVWMRHGQNLYRYLIDTRFAKLKKSQKIHVFHRPGLLWQFLYGWKLEQKPFPRHQYSRQWDLSCHFSELWVLRVWPSFNILWPKWQKVRNMSNFRARAKRKWKLFMAVLGYIWLNQPHEWERKRAFMYM